MPSDLLAEPQGTSQEFPAAASRGKLAGVSYGSLRDVWPYRARGTGHSHLTSVLSVGVRSRGRDLRGGHEDRKLEDEAQDIRNRGAIRRTEGQSKDGCCLEY